MNPLLALDDGLPDFPAIGAIRMIRIVIGRNAAPVLVAE